MMKRLLTIDINLYAIGFGIVALLALMTGCGSESYSKRLDALDEEIKAVDAASQKRSSGHKAAISQLATQLTSQLVSQKQDLDQENANLRKNLEAIKAELKNINERDDSLQLALANLGATASKEDLTRLTEDIGNRYANTQQILAEIAKESAEAVQMSSDVRTAIQRLIEAHEFFVSDSAKIIEAFGIEMTQEERESQDVAYLFILYEQRKAQIRLLNEIKNVLSSDKNGEQILPTYGAPSYQSQAEAGTATRTPFPEVRTHVQPSPRTTPIPAVLVSGPVSRKNWQIPVLGIELAYVAPGSFQMGSNDGDEDEQPVHRVGINQGYWIGKHEVTQQQYQSIMDSNPSSFMGDNNPVVNVSWNDSAAFCKKLTDQERRASRLPQGYEYRLPTEAEWEYAARGGSRGRDTKYSGSDKVDQVAWYDENSGSKTHPVGQKQANELGLYDMSGNVWEWCLDRKGDYSSGPQADPVGPGTGPGRVDRGGSWLGGASYCRVANRHSIAPTNTGIGLGFRVVLAPPVPR
jgi:formylglycine-generating enzyme required for sulfatase activity